MKRKISLLKKIKFKFWYYREQFWYFKNFIKNIFIFRKELSNFSSSMYDLRFLKKTLEKNLDFIKNKSFEIQSGKDKKIIFIERAIFILNVFIDESFIELAEDELNKKIVHNGLTFEPTEDGYFTANFHLNDDEEKNNDLIYKKSREIKKILWNELWIIIKGNEFTNYDDHDGTGLLTWWG